LSRKPNLPHNNNTFGLCCAHLLVFSSFIYLFFSSTFVTLCTNVCVFICSQAYTTRQRNPKKYENFSFARREFILSAGYISCVHVSVLLHYAFIFATVFPLFLQRTHTHTHTHIPCVWRISSLWSYTQTRVINIFIKT